MKDLSLSSISLITGIAILIMALIAGAIMGITFEELFNIENPMELYNVIQSNFSRFRLSVMGWLIIIACDLVVSWGVYSLFKTVNNKLAIYSASIRLIYTILLMIATSYLYKIIPTDGNTEVQLINQTALQASTSIKQFKDIWSAGLILFGLHLITLARLTWKLTERITIKAISWLLLLAGIGYVIINTGLYLLPQYTQIIKNIELPFIVPMILGEVGFAIWLIINRKKEFNA